MAFDAVAVRCLVKDLKDKLINSRIDKIHQPEKDEITINLRTMTDNFKLVLSASPAHPRDSFHKRFKEKSYQCAYVLYAFEKTYRQR